MLTDLFDGAAYCSEDEEDAHSMPSLQHYVLHSSHSGAFVCLSDTLSICPISCTNVLHNSHSAHALPCCTAVTQVRLSVCLTHPAYALSHALPCCTTVTQVRLSVNLTHSAHALSHALPCCTAVTQVRLSVCLTHSAYVGLARTVYIYVYIHLIFGDFQAKNTVCTPYIYGSGQP